LRRKVRRTGSGMSRPIEGQDAPFDRTAENLALKVTGRASLGRRPCARAMEIPAIHHRNRATRIGISNDFSRKPTLYSPCLEQATARRQAHAPPSQ